MPEPMSPTSRLPILIAVALLWATASAGGCASKQKKTDSAEKTAKETSQAPPSSADGKAGKPTDEQLADAPCGNPDWAKLPPEHQEDGDPDDTSAGNDDSDAADTPQK